MSRFYGTVITLQSTDVLRTLLAFYAFLGYSERQQGICLQMLFTAIRDVCHVETMLQTARQSASTNWRFWS